MPANAALAGVTIDHLRLEGGPVSVDVAAAITAADVEQSIEGASTITLTIEDDKHRLLRSGIFTQRTTCQIDRHSFEMVQVRKTGPALEVTFEDIAVAELRRHDTPRKVAAGSMTRVDFARTLVGEVPWIPFVSPEDIPHDIIKEELARGTVAAPSTPAKVEDTWTCLGRLADEVGWRCFVVFGWVYFMPELWLFGRAPLAVLREHENGVDLIDFDWDAGKIVATATVTARAERWAVPPGSTVFLEGTGPADGVWLVASVRRSLFQTKCDITLTQPRPSLPEPVQATTTNGVDDPLGNIPGLTPADSSTADLSAGGGGNGDYIWPARGTITAPFGQSRPGHIHAGIDIGVSNGTPVVASRAGTVVAAGLTDPNGYGNLVTIRHDGNTYTRYGHLSRVDVGRGQQVAQGTQIGLSGGVRGAYGSGDSSGPHLHFEIRPGDVAANPLPYLTGSGVASTTGQRLRGGQAPGV